MITPLLTAFLEGVGAGLIVGFSGAPPPPAPRARGRRVARPPLPQGARPIPAVEVRPLVTREALERRADLIEGRP